MCHWLLWSCLDNSTIIIHILYPKYHSCLKWSGRPRVFKQLTGFKTGSANPQMMWAKHEYSPRSQTSFPLFVRRGESRISPLNSCSPYSVWFKTEMIHLCRFGSKFKAFLFFLSFFFSPSKTSRLKTEWRGRESQHSTISQCEVAFYFFELIERKVQYFFNTFSNSIDIWGKNDSFWEN